MTKIDLKQLSQLAQIAIEDKESAEFYSDLNRIIELVDHMQKVDTEDVEPLSHPLDAHQRLRADIPTETVDRALNQSIAPVTEDGFYIVPRVVD
tara:strand:- start:449 stop:730 length:282 start_codon:yes stop_codon:yes gene_type:complete